MIFCCSVDFFPIFFFLNALQIWRCHRRHFFLKLWRSTTSLTSLGKLAHISGLFPQLLFEQCHFIYDYCFLHGARATLKTSTSDKWNVKGAWTELGSVTSQLAHGPTGSISLFYLPLPGLNETHTYLVQKLLKSNRFWGERVYVATVFEDWATSDIIAVEIPTIQWRIYHCCFSDEWGRKVTFSVRQMEIIYSPLQHNSYTDFILK